MNKDEHQHGSEERKVEILTIQTPNGEIPTAKSLQKLANYWNSVIENINKSNERITTVLEELNTNLGELLQKVKAREQKLDLLVESMREVKVKMKMFEEELEEVREGVEEIEKVESTNTSLEESAREILLENESEDPTKK